MATTTHKTTKSQDSNVSNRDKTAITISPANSVSTAQNKKSKEVMLSFKISKSANVLLKKIVQDRAISEQDFIAEAVLSKLEDIEDYNLADKRLKNYNSAENKSLKEVMTEYGMEV
jgi:hypothetical protein